MDLEVIARQPDNAAHAVPLLLIHGGYHGAWCWENFQSYFAGQGYASFAMNLRGHGASEGRDRLRWASASEFVDDVAAVVARIARPPVLVGHSMGGYIVQKYLERYAAAGAVLLATMPVRGGVRIFNRMMRRHPWLTIGMHLSMRTFMQIETPELARENFFSSDLPDWELRRWYPKFQPESYRIGWDMSFLNVPRPDRVRHVPLLFLGAKEDRLILPGEVAETAAAYGAQAEFFDMAHDMMLEAGWAGVAGRIHAWLKEQGF